MFVCVCVFLCVRVCVVIKCVCVFVIYHVELYDVLCVSLMWLCGMCVHWCVMASAVCAFVRFLVCCVCGLFCVG